MSRAEPFAAAEAPPLASVLAASGVAGLALGALAPSWQVAVEPAQVLAGLVTYPEGNPFHLYETSLWTAWHPLLAALLALGLDERTLSIGVSALLGMLSFLALAVFARAQGASAALAIACPFLALLLYKRVEWGIHYPIFFLGRGHTYGMAGLAVALLTVGLLGAGRWRAGAFLLGLAPAIHASLGVWVAAAAFLVGLLAWRVVRPELRAIVTGGAAGASLSAASLAWHLFAVRPAVAIDPAVADRYLDAFVRLWDAHRLAPDLTHTSALPLWLALGSALVLLAPLGPKPTDGQRFSLGILLVAGVLGLLGSGAQAWLPPGALPNALVIAMPVRLLNLDVVACAPLLVGALWRLRGDLLSQLLLAALAFSLLLAGRELLPWVVGLCSLGLVVAIARAAWRMRGSEGTAARSPEPGAGRSLVSGAVAAVMTIALVACAGRVSWRFVQASGPRFAAMPRPADEPALAAASRGSGLLAVGPGIWQAQLRTRRPVLIDPFALDMLPYALAGGPELERILREVYGIDFFAPPLHALHGAVVPEQPVRAIWRRRTPEQWHALGARYGFTEVLARRRWVLALPELARSDQLVLYGVP